MFPSLLRHLSPSPKQSKSTAPDDPTMRYYPSGFWPRVLLELQESDIAALAWSFLLHLTHGIHPTSTQPDRAIKKASEYLETFLGPAVEPLSRGKGKAKEDVREAGRTSEVYEAFVDGLLARGKGREVGGAEAVEVRCRVVVGWVAKGGNVGMF